jgi:hypothetical protein
MASAESQRQMVVPLMVATIPSAMAARASSGQCQRERGTPVLTGSSQASALMAMMTSGGKDRRATSAGLVLEAGEALLEEALAPLGDHLPRRVEPGGDGVVAQPFGGVQHDPRPHHFSVR